MVRGETRGTGGWLVAVAPRQRKRALEATQELGLELARSSVAFSDPDRGEGRDGLYLERLGIMVLSRHVSVASLALRKAVPGIVAFEPERYVTVADRGSGHSWPHRGPRDGATRRVMSRRSRLRDAPAGPPGAWWLASTRVLEAPETGADVKLAILDTGLASQHPDFVGRPIVSASFVAGDDSTEDRNGHGTACAGVACGPRQPASGARYGVAHGALLHVAKVLDDEGHGTDGSVLAGLDWALGLGCRVVSMSLGWPVGRGERASVVYNFASVRANEHGALLIAAAGNDSRRDLQAIEPVCRPANSRSILAVGAVKENGTVLFTSNGGLLGQGGEVDIAGPGARVRTAWIPNTYAEKSSTSIATAVVAGVAALLAERYPDDPPDMLWRKLVDSATPLQEPTRDVGSGLVQAYLVDVVVVLEDEARAQIDSVAGLLEAEGMVVVRKLVALGLIVGVVAEDRVDELEAVPGVFAVERAHQR